MNEQAYHHDQTDDDTLTHTVPDETLEVAAADSVRWAYTDINNFTRRGFCC
jgi:hypothetical protein